MDCQYIVVLDIGTTNLRASAFTESGCLVGSKKHFVTVISESSGQMEIDPLSLFNQVIQVLLELFLEHNITKSNILSLGISTHRNSFLLWDRVTGNPYSNVICWNDKRSKKTAEDLNRSLFVRSIKTVVRAITNVWSPGRFQMLKDFKFRPQHVLVRLYWLIYEQEKISKEKLKNSLYGTLETWIVWKLTRGKFHITDLSSVSTTSMYDISTNTWNYDLLLYIGIPFSILPRIVKTHGHVLAVVNPKYFGFELNITALIADQQAASVGCGCIESGDSKLTLGSGTFIDITTGPTFNASLKHNCYPVVGWANKQNFCYIYEGNSSDTGVKILNFLKTEGLDINQPEILSILLDELPTNSENNALCLRARDVLESIVFEFYRLWKKMASNYAISEISSFRANGGVSNCDYILQCISTLCQLNVYRMDDIEGTSVGTMLLARDGEKYQLGDWPFNFEKTFSPQDLRTRHELLKRYKDYINEKSVD